MKAKKGEANPQGEKEANFLKHPGGSILIKAHQSEEVTNIDDNTHQLPGQVGRDDAIGWWGRPRVKT